MAKKNKESLESIKDRFLFRIKSIRVIMKLNITIIFLIITTERKFKFRVHLL